MNRKAPAFVLFSIALAAALATTPHRVEATCSNSRASAATDHTVDGPADPNCPGCVQYRDSWSSSDGCEDSEGDNCVWTPNVVTVTRTPIDCCQEGTPYELPTKLGEYRTHACFGFLH
jgi:hypothetical protein